MKLQTVFWQEDDMYIIKEIITGITTQGHTLDDALVNIKEAVSLYIKEMPDVKDTIKNMNLVGISSVEIS